MKTFQKWAAIYLFLLAGLIGIGFFNYQAGQRYEVLLEKENELKYELVATSKQHYELLSPLALQDWANKNGYIPMATANWERSRP